jgi:hypothetical protein
MRVSLQQIAILQEICDRMFRRAARNCNPADRGTRAFPLHRSRANDCERAL